MERNLEQQQREHAKKAGLHYKKAGDFKIQRIRHGKSFSYQLRSGLRVTDEKTLARIRKLAIPPAYQDVWIAKDPLAHLQVVGTDARGRKQYRYHANWRKVKDLSKYDRMIKFAKCLPKIRAATAADLKAQGLPKNKVLAVIVQLLEKTLIRVGNDEYARTNQSYGLSTLLDRHVQLNSKKVIFRFKGKSNVQHEIELNDPTLAKVVKKCRDVPGQLLFQYEDEKGGRHAIHSQDVNHYLQEITHQEFTAKDFRTWGGTVFAAIALREFEHFDSTAEAKRNLNQVIETVAQKLGNTKTICKNSYIHPVVMDSYLNGEVVRAIARRKHPITAEELHLETPDEKRVLNFLVKKAKSK